MRLAEKPPIRLSIGRASSLRIPTDQPARRATHDARCSRLPGTLRSEAPRRRCVRQNLGRRADPSWWFRIRRLLRFALRGKRESPPLHAWRRFRAPLRPRRGRSRRRGLARMRGGARAQGWARAWGRARARARARGWVRARARAQTRLRARARARARARRLRARTRARARGRGYGHGHGHGRGLGVGLGRGKGRGAQDGAGRAADAGADPDRALVKQRIVVGKLRRTGDRLHGTAKFGGSQ